MDRVRLDVSRHGFASGSFKNETPLLPLHLQDEQSLIDQEIPCHVLRSSFQWQHSPLLVQQQEVDKRSRHY